MAVRSGAARVEWMFGENDIRVVTEGYEFIMQLAPASVRSVVVPGGRGDLLERPGVALKDVTVPNRTALALTNGLTVQYTIPFHASGSGRMVSTCYCNGSVKPGRQIEFDLKLGGAANGAELLNGFALEGLGADDTPLKQDGNRGAGVVHFPQGARIALAGRIENVGAADMDAKYRLSVEDHYAPWH